MSTTSVDRYVGVDVSKSRLDAAVRPTGERYTVVNDPEDIDTLVGRLVETGPPPELMVLEATAASSAQLRRPSLPRGSLWRWSTPAKRGTSPRPRAARRRPTR
jgi:hypothetical protein